MKKIVTLMMALLVMCMTFIPVFALHVEIEKVMVRVPNSETQGVMKDGPVTEAVGRGEEVEDIFGKEKGPDMLALAIAIAVAAGIMGFHYLDSHKRNQYVYNPENESLENAINEIIGSVKSGVASKAPQNFSQGTYSGASTASNPAYDANRHMMDEMTRQVNQQSMDFAMEESRKAVTPFDHGGYQQGYGVNPSDTMAGDLNNMMNNMNNMGGTGF